MINEENAKSYKEEFYVQHQMYNNAMSELDEYKEREQYFREKNEILREDIRCYLKYLEEEKEKKKELCEKYESLKKTYEEKISKLELENKSLTEKSKELSKLLADFLSKAELNKNIEHIEWFPSGKKPEKEKTYLVRFTYKMINLYSIGFTEYDHNNGWKVASDCTITHWAEVKGPKL